jgi:hypothetical protein
VRIVRLLSSITLAFGLAGLGVNVSAHGPGTGTSADGIMVTRHFTGLWDQVDQEAQGIALQVIEQLDDSRRAVAYWYTYGADRNTTWFMGIGNLVENRIEFELYDSTDVGFMQDALPVNDSVHSIGTMAISFGSCSSGLVTYDTDHDVAGSGSFRIERLAEIMNTHCTGGISDDMHADAMFGEQRIELLPAGGGVSGSAYARYEDFPGHSEFKVDVEGLPDGDYHLYVGMQERGDFIVQNGRGEIEFASPAEDGKMLLNFDPRGMQIEIHDASGATLSSFDDMFDNDDHHYGGMYGDDDDHNYDCQDGSGSGHGMGGGGMGGMGGGMHDCVDDGEYIDIQASLDTTGMFPDARGHAEWDMNSHRVQFSVEIENVPAGIYTLNVGGVDVGVIEAFQMHFGVYGHISFRDPESYGMQHLDFEPRGEMIKVLQGSNTILEIEFPTE